LSYTPRSESQKLPDALPIVNEQIGELAN